MDESQRWVFSWSELGENEVYYDYESDPELKPLVRSAGATFEHSKILQGVEHAGSGTLEEIYELAELMRRLIPKYSYRELESYLITLGYNLKLIRRTYQRLTGLNPNEVQNTEYLLTPPQIPQMNCGWGEAKGKSDSWYFIMPWDNSYAMFSQVGDLDRTIVDKFVTLESALDNLGTRVKQVYTNDKPFDGAIDDSAFRDRSPEFLPVGFGVKISKEDEKKDKDGDEDENNDTVSDELNKAEFFDSKPPAELLDSTLSEKFPVVEIIEEIMKHMDDLQSDIDPYRLELGGVQFLVNERSTPEHTPKVDTVQVSTPSFASQAVISLMFTIIGNEKRKKGLSVFLFTPDGELLNNGTFKGTDSKVYALSREGLDSYFGV